jgi:hypothetical protein
MSIVFKAGFISTLLLAAPINEAKNATATELNVSGMAHPGATVIAHVKVTGPHLYFHGFGAVGEGSIGIFVQGKKVASIKATKLNTTYLKSRPAYCGSYKCRYYWGDPTIVDYPIDLPRIVGSSVVIEARYLGDDFAHASNSPPVTLTVRPRDVSAALNLILN